MASSTTWTVTTNLDVEDSEGLTLREAISIATEGDTIVFDASLKGSTISLQLGELTIDKSITIDASAIYDATDDVPGITINGNASSRVFKVTGGTADAPVQLIGLNITGGEAIYGGGIYNSGTLTVMDSMILENSAYSDSDSFGGGIYNEGELTIENSTIWGNLTVSYFDTYSLGGGIYNKGELIVMDSMILENSVYAGGGIFNEGTLTVTYDSTVSENLASGYGGGICNKGELTIENSTIWGNSTISYSDSSTFGGGICNDGTLTITNSTISENSADSDSYGGGIFNFGTLTITNSTISGNSAYAGGGIYNYGTLTVTNYSTVSGSLAADSRGGGNYNGSTLTITNSKISENSANYGGGVVNSGGALTVVNSTISGNLADYGGGINNYSINSVVTLYNSIVVLNVATSSGNDLYQESSGTIQGYNNLSSFTAWAGESGENYVYDATQPLFTDAANGDYTLAANSQAINKGDNAYAVYPDGTAITLDLAGKARIVDEIVDIGAYEYTPDYMVTTNLDVVDPDDGVLSLREALSQADSGELVAFASSLAGKTIVLNGSQLVVNKAITIDATSLEAAGITIDAEGKSSVLNVSGGTENSPVTLVNLTLTDGKTAWYGGLLYAKDFVSVQNCKFVDGFAYYGGAIANEGTLTIEKNCEFNGNQGSYGGAIFNRSTGILTISDVVATANSVTNYGGVLYNNGTATVTNSDFQQNSSKNCAGAIYVAAGSVSVAGSTFVDNTSANFGGTIYNAGTFDISTSSVTGGSSIYGGAIANFKTLTVANCYLITNSATQQGGGIYHSSSIAVNITDSTISDNSAYQGGGLYVRIGTVRLTGTKMKLNSATHNGGAIYNGNQTVLTDCVVSKNSAKYYGGAIYNEKIVRLNGKTTVDGNSTETGNSPNIHTKSGGQVIVSSELADSVFDENDDWTIEL